jgi:ATP-independent RNA helicase DbpA
MTESAAASFSSLNLARAQIANLDTLGYHEMTPIQAQSLPVVLEGRDLIARAKTGSGKTAAFGLGLLHKLDPRLFRVQGLVICPTRELAEQVSKELRRLAQGIPNIKVVSLCGGKPFGPQKASLQHGAHIAVGTPGRILDHLNKQTLQLSALHTLVLDEADRMLDMGFSEITFEIVRKLPTTRQTLLFSATYPQEIKKMSRSIQRDPVEVTVEAQHHPDAIEQVFYQVKQHQRNDTLLGIFEHYHPQSALVFCFTKKQCAEVAMLLNDNRIESLALHGDLDQRERDRVLVQFANNSYPVLVATDVAARGLDIKSLQAVINYELPRDPEIYVHRIGRTARAGQTGIALSIITEAELVRAQAIEEYRSEPCIYDVSASLDRQPEFSLQAPMATIQVDAGRKHKMRPGDLLGALTGDAELPGSTVGKIDVFDMFSFVALERESVKQALSYLANGKVKGRKIKARKIL